MGRVTAIWLPKYRIAPDGGVYSAYCDILGIATSGPTEERAEENLKNALISYCKSLEEIGKLCERLDEKGIPYKTIEPESKGKREKASAESILVPCLQ